LANGGVTRVRRVTLPQCSLTAPLMSTCRCCDHAALASPFSGPNARTDVPSGQHTPSRRASRPFILKTYTRRRRICHERRAPPKDEAVADDEVADRGHTDPQRRGHERRQDMTGRREDEYVEQTRPGDRPMEHQPTSPQRVPPGPAAPGEGIVQGKVHLRGNQESNDLGRELVPPMARQESEQDELDDGGGAAAERETERPRRIGQEERARTPSARWERPFY